MKTRSFLGLIAIGTLAFAGCATETTSTTQTQTDQTTTRVHTQDELRKTGESQTGPALEKTDAAIRTDGNR
jgi:PBP1b-binding outer membrane lipoprotein LpoB